MSDKKSGLRVLHILGSLNLGGTEIFVMNLYRNIDKKVIQFDFLKLTKEGDYFESEVKRMGGKVFSFPLSEMNKYIQCIKSAKLIRDFLKINRYDIVHVHGCSFLDLIRGTLGAKWANIPVRIAHSHSVGTPKGGSIDGAMRAFMKKIISATANEYFACSNTAAESKYTKNILNKKLVYNIHNAIDLNKFCYKPLLRNQLREELNISDDTIIIGNVGRFENEKNHIFMIKIFSEYLKINSNSKLVLVGDGSLLSNIEKYIFENKLIDKVVLTGRIQNTEDFYQIFDVFILPSLYEGFPFVAVEAQAAGLPSIFSNNITEEVKILNTSKMLSIDNPVKWSEAIDIFTKTPIERNTREILKLRGFEITDVVNELTKYYISKF